MDIQKPCKILKNFYFWLLLLMAIVLFSWNEFGSNLINYFYSDKDNVINYDMARLVMNGSAGILGLFGIVLAVLRMKQTDKTIEISQEQFKLAEDNSQKQFQLAREQFQLAEKQFQIAEDNRLDNRFKDAVTLLGNSSRSVRIGALYSLVEISKSESKRITASEDRKENPTYESPYPKAVVEIICGFIRNQSNDDFDCFKKSVDKDKFIEDLKKGKAEEISEDKVESRFNEYVINTYFKIKDDVQTALNLLFKNHSHITEEYLKLIENSGKTEAQVIGEYYENVLFKNVKRVLFDLSKANLCGASLDKAYMRGIRARGLVMPYGGLQGADLQGADLGPYRRGADEFKF